MKRILSVAGMSVLLLLAGCGNESTPPSSAIASKLTYTDPVAAAGDWQLMQDATSTNTRLVLNLVGPSDGSKYRGIGFTLQVDTSKVQIGKFAADADNPAGYYRDGGVFFDKQMTPTGMIDIPTTLQVGGVNQDKLMVGIFQKADDYNWGPETYEWGVPYPGTTAKNCYRVVLQVAIDFDPLRSVPVGEVALTALKAKVIPELINTPETRQLQPIELKVGNLVLK